MVNMGPTADIIGNVRCKVFGVPPRINAGEVTFLPDGKCSTMSLFTRFFARRKKQFRNVSSIYDLFSFNLKHLPDTSFQKIQSRVIDGKYYSIYNKKLKKRELGLFDEVEVRTPREFESKIICFIVSDLEHLDIQKLTNFIETCSGLFATNELDFQLGKLNEEDIDAIAKRSWIGREWRKVPSTIHISLTANRLEVKVSP